MSIVSYYGAILGEESDDLLRNGLKISEKAALLEVISQSRFVSLQLENLGSSEAVTRLENALEYARTTRDKVIICSALDFLAYNIYFMATVTEDSDQFKILADKWRGLLEESEKLYLPISMGLPRHSVLAASHPFAVHFWFSAQYETDAAGKKRGPTEF